MSSRAKKPHRGSQSEQLSDLSQQDLRSKTGNEDHHRRDGQGGLEASPESDESPSFQEFTKVGIGQLLDCDPRPTFVVQEDFEVDLEPVFLNRSLRLNEALVDLIPFKVTPTSPRSSSKTSTVDFSSWIKDASRLTDSRAPTIIFGGFFWTAFVVKDRWIVVSGERHLQEPGRISRHLRSASPASTTSGYRTEIYKDPSSPPRKQRAVTGSQLLRSPSEQKEPAYMTPGTPDWTLTNPEGDLSPHVIFARSIDWGATPLGDMSTWTPEFRQTANHLMSNPHPAALFWGDELTVMYNKPYADTVAGNKHPLLMGTGFRGPFKELWDFVHHIFAECTRSGKAVAVDEQMLPIERHGFLEETFYSWSLTPLYGGTSRILGLYNAPFEVTRQTRSARALRTLLKLGQETALADSVAKFWPRILKSLEENEFDFPFVLLYSVSEEMDNEDDDSASISQSSESSSITKSCILEGTLGVPDDHPAAPKKLDLKRSRGGFIPAFREAMKTREPKLLNFTDGSVPESLLEGIRWRGFGERCREAIICPVRSTTSVDNVMGFLFIGINPRRPFDQDYQSFIQLIDRQLATSLASVSLLETEIRRGLTAAEAAALERSRLSEELAVQRSRLQRVAEVSPVGMFSIDAAGTLLEANDRWYEMTDHPRDAIFAMSWLDTLTEDCLELMDIGWKRLTVDQLPWSGELKLKKKIFDPESGEAMEFWILAAAQPEFADGEMKTIMGSITDITPQKRSAKDAETRAKLSEQLLLRTQEAKENEKNFKRFSDLAPGGLVIMTPDGKIEYANSQWYKISGHPQTKKDAGTALSWTNAILEDDQFYFSSKWDELIDQKKTVTIEARMQTPWEGEIGGSIIKTQRWILASLFPEVSEDGALISLMGCITDISSIKWAEGLQNRRLKEAEETRRAQNNFIDITSHEMRNPLSAILQCADGISVSLSGLLSKVRPIDHTITEAIKESISSAETIQLCAQHQKSIVDDILTISKLDSNLLVISPVPCQPINIVRQTLQMFFVECQKVHDIKLEFHIDDSFNELKLETVMIDNSRLLQVLINLITNAIKFTKTSKTRTIDVSISAYLEPPTEDIPGFDYFPTDKARSDVTAGSDWGNGEILYLRFEVKDSGCGLTPDEKKKLFNRFTQASPRTHVQYGGSGLGLFISRQLTELQGGEIGVASVEGVGSIFAFYVKSRRSESPITEATAIRVSGELESTARIATDVTEVIETHDVSKLHQLKNAAGGIAAPGASTDFDHSDWHVLIVEDNLVNQRILAQQIKKLGCVVHLANHGQEALDLISKTKYYKGHEDDGLELSVILMDLEMPVMDGLTCVRQIREMEGKGLISRHLPIIAVTANARGEQIAAAKNSGMDDVMPKPFRIRQLVPKIELLIHELTR